ncbi:MAG: M20/M25/M40 family metallo-hydrolase [Desulfobacula sp.]|nr:M20/M25/M40 family metallo-hydrolase [Desulfobacula sp.]
MDIQNAIRRLSDSIKLKTVSNQIYSTIETKPFLDFQIFLETSFPGIHENLEKKVINSYSLLYKWPGKNSESEPIAFLAHYDVVPVEPGTKKDWLFKPFSGEIADGFVWGRGTLDMKGALMAIMEAVEKLLNDNFSPERTIYLAFGHDEEIGGTHGALHISNYLKKQGIRFSYTLDEGMAIIKKEISPSQSPLGIIGVAEKGYVSLKLETKSQGGHSAIPPFKTAIGALCKAMNRLEKNQMPARLTSPISDFFKAIGPRLPIQRKLLFANKWIFKHLILYLLGKSDNTNAMIRTTAAPTMMQAGIKENVLPCYANLLINFRILPGDSIKKVIKHVKKTITNDSINIQICKDIVSEPSPISSSKSKGFLNIQKTIRRIFPDTLVAPGLVSGTTDSRHYSKISDNCYRFTPFVFGPDDTRRIHGTNERISIDNYVHGIQYYIQLIKNSSANY